MTTPFLRGCVFPPRPEAAYPRAELETPVSRLPQDVLGQAAIPAGVRLEFEGRADAVEIGYRCAAPAPHLAGALDITRILRPQMRPSFALWSRSECLAEAPAAPEGGRVTLPLAGDGPYAVYLPELLCPVIEQFRAIGGTVHPRAARPVMLVYGDSITEGLCASAPALAWPMRAARALDLDLVNLGYGGAARGEIAAAQMIAKIPGELLIVAFGTNCWTRVPMSAALFRETLEAFLDIAAAGTPRRLILCVSPPLRPDAETTRNPLGATLQDIRSAFETVASRRGLPVVNGLPLCGPAQLTDGIHPDDEGHRRIAEAVVAAIESALPHETSRARPSKDGKLS